MTEFDIFGFALVHIIVDFARYAVVAGIFFLVFYKFGSAFFAHRRIQKERSPNPKRMRREFFFSVLTVVIFASQGVFISWAKMNGGTLIYTDIADFGWLYFLTSIFIYIVIHDAYFYWSHRLMHSRKLYRLFHLEHHRSVSPSPWAAYAFHPLEAMVEAAVFPLLVFTIPAHSLALFIFLMHMIVRNVIGHLGYEMYATGFTKRRFLGQLTTAVHHDLHHRRGQGNYGLYFTWWDRLLGTEAEDYHEQFEAVVSCERLKNKKSVVADEAGGLRDWVPVREES